MPDYPAKLQRRFGATVRSERLTRHLTQQEVALASELSLTYIGEIERGERMASLLTLDRLAKALDQSASELLGKAGM